MKRVLTCVATALLVMGTATGALAAFDMSTFMSSVNDGNTEILAAADWDAFDGLQDNTISNFFNQDLSEFGNADVFAGLTFGGAAGEAYGNMLENYDLWTTVTDIAAAGTNWNGANAVGEAAGTAVNAQGTGDIQILNPNAGQGFRGTLGDELFTFTGVDNTLTLEAFDAWTAGQTISLAMDIIHYSSTDWANSWTVEDTGADLLITRNGDGTIATSIVTPIPAAAWLLGSGLLALVGIRRKRA